MNRQKMLRLLEEKELDPKIVKSPSRVEVFGFFPEWENLDDIEAAELFDIMDTYLQRTLKKEPSSIGIAYALGRQLRPQGVAWLYYDPKQAGWFLYLYPRATDQEIQQAVDQARTVLVPVIDKAKADRLQGVTQ